MSTEQNATPKCQTCGAATRDPHGAVHCFAEFKRRIAELTVELKCERGIIKQMRQTAVAAWNTRAIPTDRHTSDNAHLCCEHDPTKKCCAQFEPLPDQPLCIRYMNYRGETAVRHIIPQRLWFGVTEWHPEPQWMLDAHDVDKDLDRTFALSGIGQAVSPEREAVHRALNEWLDSMEATAKAALLSSPSTDPYMSAIFADKLARQRFADAASTYRNTCITAARKEAADGQ